MPRTDSGGFNDRLLQDFFRPLLQPLRPHLLIEFLPAGQEDGFIALHHHIARNTSVRTPPVVIDESAQIHHYPKPAADGLHTEISFFPVAGPIDFIEQTQIIKNAAPHRKTETGGIVDVSNIILGDSTDQSRNLVCGESVRRVYPRPIRPVGYRVYNRNLGICGETAQQPAEP